MPNDAGALRVSRSAEGGGGGHQGIHGHAWLQKGGGGMVLPPLLLYLTSNNEQARHLSVLAVIPSQRFGLYFTPAIPQTGWWPC